jgi:hypothetical protein
MNRYVITGFLLALAVLIGLRLITSRPVNPVRMVGDSSTPARTSDSSVAHGPAGGDRITIEPHGASVNLSAAPGRQVKPAMNPESVQPTPTPNIAAAATVVKAAVPPAADGAAKPASGGAKARPEVRGLDPKTMDKGLAKTLARESLKFVGVEKDATAFWAQTVDDPGQPAEVRRNLIEDLNEDGFADPKHITAEDLPLIEMRLQLIARMSNSPIDDVNAAALAEAEKDLTNMLVKLKGM